MIRVKGFDRPEIAGAKGTQIQVESDEYLGGGHDIRFLLVDGILETYTIPYNLPAGVCLSVLLLDAFYDDVTAPFSDDPQAVGKFLKISKLADKRIVWECDKNALLSAVTLDLDDPESVAGTWIATERMLAERAVGHQRRREELLADSMVGDLVAQRDQAGLKNSDKWARIKK